MTESLAATVFSIPELLELILLSLTANTTYQEIQSTRTILTGQIINRAWRNTVWHSPSIREKLYLPTQVSATCSHVAWNVETAFPPAQPNPWIPFVLLNQRSWGSAYPFFGGGTNGEPRNWTFSFEMSRAQFRRAPRHGSWREMLACLPPFTSMWYTRCFYELGSGRAPFVTHIDYDGEKLKSQQKYCISHTGGITLGMIIDAVAELFELSSDSKFVMIESLRETDGNDGSIDRPVERIAAPSDYGGEQLDMQYSGERGPEGMLHS